MATRLTVSVTWFLLLCSLILTILKLTHVVSLTWAEVLAPPIFGYVVSLIVGVLLLVGFTLGMI